MFVHEKNRENHILDSFVHWDNRFYWQAIFDRVGDSREGSYSHEQEGSVTGFLGTVRDITKLEQAKADLVYLKQYYEKIVASFPSSLLILDKNLNIKSGNRTYKKIRGICNKDVVGKNIKEVFPEQLLKDGGLLKVIDEVVQTHETHRLNEIKHISSSHTEKILNITVSDLRSAEEELILLIEDITERVRLRQEIREKNKELESFVYIVSHDLKAPIVSMQGFSSMLLNEYREKLGAEGARYIDRIMANASRMEVLVTDLLTLSRLGRVVGDFKDISSFDIVNKACNELEALLKKNGTEVSISDSLPVVHCDGARIYQVFENLITNAIKFTRIAEKPAIEIRYEDKENFHQFCVKDNGIGIDKKYQRNPSSTKFL